MTADTTVYDFDKHNMGEHNRDMAARRRQKR